MMGPVLRTRWAKVFVFVLCLVPLGLLVANGVRGNLGANPIEYITRETGDWTMRLLLATLAITPLRRLIRQPDLIRFRRMLGLFSFFYAVLHLFTWAWLDKFFDPSEMWADVTKRRFITMGMLAFVLLIPLAATSTTAAIRMMGGKRWQMLHRLVYVSTAAGIVHYFWLVKSDIRMPVLYGVILAGLLLLRPISVRLAGRRTPPKHKDGKTPATIA